MTCRFPLAFWLEYRPHTHDGGAAGGEDEMRTHSNGKGQGPHELEAGHGGSFIRKLLRPVGHNRGPDKVLVRNLIRGTNNT